MPTVLQMETTECGAACLGMILAYHRNWVPLETLRVRCGISRDGSNAANMLRAAREYGLTARGFRSEREQLFDLPFPMVVFWEFNHFVVLEGIEGRRVYINDPSEGPRRLSREEFEESYSGMCFAFEPGPDFRRGGTAPSLLRGLAARLGRVWSPLAFAAFATLALIVPGIAIPAMIKVFIDDVLIRQNVSWVTPLLFGLALAAGAQGALTWLQRGLLARMETKLSIVTTTRFFWHVATLPMLFFSQRYAGDIASRVLSNDAVARLLSGELAVNTINLLAMVFYAVVMLSYDVPLTVIAIVMVAINLMAPAARRPRARKRKPPPAQGAGQVSGRLHRRHPNHRDAEGQRSRERLLRALVRHARECAQRSATARPRDHARQRRSVAALSPLRYCYPRRRWAPHPRRRAHHRHTDRLSIPDDELFPAGAGARPVRCQHPDDHSDRGSRESAW